MKHHILSSIKYFSKWGWLIDGKRIAINNSVLSNKPVPKLNLDFRHKEQYNIVVRTVMPAFPVADEQYA
jgi:hypothetical protein